MEHAISIFKKNEKQPFMEIVIINCVKTAPFTTSTTLKQELIQELICKRAVLHPENDLLKVTLLDKREEQNNFRARAYFWDWNK